MPKGLSLAHSLFLPSSFSWFLTMTSHEQEDILTANGTFPKLSQAKAQSKQWDLDLHPGSDRSLIIGKIAYCSFKTKTWILVVKMWNECRKKANYLRVSVWIWMAMEPLRDIQLMKQYIKIGSSEATRTQARTHSVRCVSLCVETQTRTRSLGVTQ